MSSRLVLNGRVVAASAGTRAATLAARRDWEARSWSLALPSGSDDYDEAPAPLATPGPTAAVAPLLAAPPPRALPTPAAPTYHDPETGVTFKVLPGLRTTDGWVTGATMAGWFNILPATLHHLARGRFIDAAVEPGSPTRRYRAADKAAVTREVNRLRAERRAALAPDKPAAPAVPTTGLDAPLSASPPNGRKILGGMSLERRRPAPKPGR